MIRAEWRLFLTAVQFLTRCPVPAWVGHGPDQLDQATRYFPLVGVCVGLWGMSVFVVASTGLPTLVAALLSVVATVLVTGAFHEDGLADTCDGLFGSWTREDALRIMKDSRIGSFGAAGLVLVLGLKVAATAVPAAIVAAHACSRFMAVCVIAGLPYVRGGGKSQPVAGGVGRTELGIAGLCGLLPLLLLGWQAVPALLLAAGVTALLAFWFRRRLGGYTGDCLGATQQVAEVAVLLAVLWRAG